MLNRSNRHNTPHRPHSWPGADLIRSSFIFPLTTTINSTSNPNPTPSYRQLTATQTNCINKTYKQQPQQTKPFSHTLNEESKTTRLITSQHDVWFSWRHFPVRCWTHGAGIPSRQRFSEAFKGEPERASNLGFVHNPRH